MKPLLLLIILTTGVCQEENCILNTYDFLTIYRIYFKDVYTVILKIIETNDPSQDITYYADQVSKVIFNNWRQKPAFWVLHSVHLNNFSKPKPTLTPRKKTSWTYKNEFFQDVTSKIKTNSRDKRHAYIIIIWDEFVLSKVLDEHHKIIIKQPRGLYVFLFIERFQNETILSQFWLKFRVFNVMAVSLCFGNHVLVYNPFHLENSSFGKVLSLTIEQIAENPNKIFDFMDDFNGYPIKISLFHRPPTSLSTIPKPIDVHGIYSILNKSQGFGGLDGVLAATLSSNLNFTPIISIPPDKFGVVEGTNITGSLGEVIRGEIDFSANGRFLMSYGADDFQFTNPVMSNIVCAVVPKSEKIPKWMMIFHGFKKESWILFLGNVIVCSVFWHFAVNFEVPVKKLKRRRFVISMLDVIAVILNVSIRMPKRLDQRVFMASLLALNVIATGIFQGTLVQSFTTTSHYPDINTLEQLDASGLSIATSLRVFDNNSSDVISRLHSKITAINSTALNRAAYQRDVAAMERKEDAKFLISTEYMNNGLPLLHIVNECPSTYFITYIVPNNSPFLPKFNSVILNFFESGLIAKWYDDFIEAIILEKIFKYQDNSKVNKPFNLSDIQTAFYILFMGIIISGLVFVGEIVCSKM